MGMGYWGRDARANVILSEQERAFSFLLPMNYNSLFPVCDCIIDFNSDFFKGLVAIDNQ